MKAATPQGCSESLSLLFNPEPSVVLGTERASDPKAGDTDKEEAIESRNAEGNMVVSFFHIFVIQCAMSAALEIDWKMVRTLHATGLHTFKELAKMFEVNISTLLNRAMRENWNKERDAVRANMIERDKPRTIDGADGVIAIASDLVGRENFRDRIAGHVEKVIARLDTFPVPHNDRDADLRLTVLEKAERVGSRGYGLEEKSGVNVLINLSALGTDTYEVPELGLEPIGDTEVVTP